MKKLFLFLSIVFAGLASMAQASPREKAVLHSDMVKERNERHAVARNVLTGHPGRAKAHHRAAVAYHKRIHSDVATIHNNDVKRAERRHRRRY